MVGYIFGPRLYRLFEWSQTQLNRKTGARDYELNTFEWIGERYINSVKYAISFSCYCSPIIAYYVWTRGMMTNQGQWIYCMKVIAAFCVGLASAYIIRGYGRMGNPDYRKFLKDLTAARKDQNNREALQLYDFEFHAWPVDFRWNESSIKSNVIYEDLTEKKSFFNIFSWPSRLLQYTLAHGLGRPMAFPGSVKLLQLAMSHALLDGRTALIEKNGLRSKLLTEDGNHIDTMFIDSRSDESRSNGNTLVICCEGNAAFYELGCMGTPMKAGYSVLGWNHPGFGGSTGLPSPDSERNAIDAVVRYAVTRLGFNVEDIVVFAWSIGGFTASYAGMMYPNIRALILDATFDNITRLALAKMPDFAGDLVKIVVKNYMNLDNVRHICKYPGPVRLIRRQRDELISLVPGDPSTNRGNILLLSLLYSRYPHIFVDDACKAVQELLSADDTQSQNAIIESIGGINRETCESRLTIDTDKPIFPLEIGKTWSLDVKIETALYLAMVHMTHFDATHCMPLPSTYFQLPWQHPVNK